jgi:alanine-glyoxylate transaminase/serine-glyoxylate transaminase/serine-pyruvate transaminase
VIYPASGTGAWEAALVNTLSPGDTVLAFETGHFATLWREMAGKLAGRVFRIGHLGHFNDLTLAGTLAGVQMGLQLAAVPVHSSGVDVALELLRA